MNINTSSRSINVICALGGLKSYHNRLILGVSSLASQPFIDSRNKGVDEETRKYSVARTVTKICVGTLVGVATRYAAPKLLKGFIAKQIGIDDRFKDGLGEVIAMIATIFTTIAIDVPLTNAVLNKVLGKLFPDKTVKKDGK